DRPVLIFSDRGEESDATGNTWLVQLTPEKDASAYSGPFILDRTHPVTEGLSLRSAIWGAGKTQQVEGSPIVMAGNIPLLTDIETATGKGSTRHEFRIRFRPDLSTLQESADWPILIWYILSMRRAALPCLERQHIRLGEEALLNLADYTERIKLTPPGQTQRDLTVKGRMVSLRGNDIGLYTATLGDTEFRFAVNA